MKTSRPSPLRLSVVAFCALAALAPAFAFTPREQQTAQAAQPASKEFVRRELHLSSSNLGIQEGQSRLADSEAWSRFLAEQGGDAEAYIDPRSGTPSSIVLRVPIIPGLGSTLVRRDGAVLGAVGVSGGKPEQDLDCAEAGLKALGK